MNKKLVSFIGLMAIASSCSTGHKNVTTKKPITRIPEKVLVESKRTEAYINKEEPETPEELQATSAVKVTPALIREYIATYKDIAMVEMQRYGIPASITLAQAMRVTTSVSSAIMTGRETPSPMMMMPKANASENTNTPKPPSKTILNSL